MYSLIKNKRLWIENKEQSPLHFCLFLNNDNLLLLLQDKTFNIVNLLGESIYHSPTLTKQGIIDCKRIGKNTCAVITERRDQIIFIHMDQYKNVTTKQMLIQNADFVQNLKTTVQIIPFSEDQFVIMHRYYDNKIIHLFVLTKKQNKCYQYQTKIISQQIQWISSNFDIVKPLQMGNQFAIYQQRETSEQIQWRIKFVPIKETYQRKIIDLKTFLTNSHLIVDILVRDTNEYYLFTRKQMISSQEQIQVWSVRMYENQGTFIQSCSLLTNYKFNNTNLMQIVTVNYKYNYFITKNHAYEMIKGQIYDNTLQIVNLQTGIILQKLYCNLKSFDVSLNKQLIIDYSQQINHLEKNAIHIRLLFTKKVIYYFFMQNAEIFRVKKLERSFQSLVLESL